MTNRKLIEKHSLLAALQYHMEVAIEELEGIELGEHQEKIQKEAILELLRSQGAIGRSMEKLRSLIEFEDNPKKKSAS